MHNLGELQRLAYLNNQHTFDSRLKQNGAYYFSCLCLLLHLFSQPSGRILIYPGYLLLGGCLFILIANLIIKTVTPRFVLTKIIIVALINAVLSLDLLFHYLVVGTAGFGFFAILAMIFSIARLAIDWKIYLALEANESLPRPSQKSVDFFNTILTYLKTVNPDKDPEVFTFTNPDEHNAKYRVKIAGGLVAVYCKRNKSIEFIPKESFSLTEQDLGYLEKPLMDMATKSITARIQIGNRVIFQASVPPVSRDKLVRFLEADRGNSPEASAEGEYGAEGEKETEHLK